MPVNRPTYESMQTPVPQTKTRKSQNGRKRRKTKTIITLIIKRISHRDMRLLVSSSGTYYNEIRFFLSLYFF